YKDRTIGQVLNKQTEITEKFKNRLSWSSEFFTLSDLRSDDSGLYTVESTREVETSQSYQLNVYVFLYFVVSDKVSTPRVTNLSHYSPESDLCLLQCSVRNVRGLNLTWFRGNVQLNQTNSSSPETTLILPLEIQQIDKDIFSCEASNPVSKQSITVNFTKLCPHKLDNRSYIIPVIITVIPVVLSLAVIVMITFKERRKQETSRSLKGRYLITYFNKHLIIITVLENLVSLKLCV
uniref:Ig-like domain-containing protein n=1 Tax=Astyanax mexicanus TaxID=7994 RepID=A0A8B9JTR3_ASTMX